MREQILGVGHAGAAGIHSSHGSISKRPTAFHADPACRQVILWNLASPPIIQSLRGKGGRCRRLDAPNMAQMREYGDLHIHPQGPKQKIYKCLSSECISLQQSYAGAQLRRLADFTAKGGSTTCGSAATGSQCGKLHQGSLAMSSQASSKAGAFSL